MLVKFFMDEIYVTDSFELFIAIAEDRALKDNQFYCMLPWILDK